MLYHELDYFMNKRILDEEPKLAGMPDFKFNGFEPTEKRFLELFENLSDY